MKAGLSGTSCLAPGFDMKQMMTLSVTAFPLSNTHARTQRELCEDLDQASSGSAASRPTSLKTGESLSLKHTHTRTRA